MLALVPILILCACDSSGVRVLSFASNEPLEDGIAYSDSIPEEAELTLAGATEEIDFGNSDGAFIQLQIGAALPSDGRSHIEGEWSASFSWPLSPIHAALLPNGTVLSYGAAADRAKRGRAFEIDRWDPAQGFSQAAHELAPSGISTNVFCSAQSVLPDGNVLISGGDRQGIGATTGNIRNEGVRSTTLYTTNTNMLSELPNMRYPRWYPTLVTLGNGRQVALGGRAEKKDADSAQTVPTVPEVYLPTRNRWKTLTGAKAENYYKGTWFYPRAFLNKRGQVTVFSNTSPDIYELDTRRTGSFNKVGTMVGNATKLGAPFPAAMYRPGKVIVMAKNGSMHSVDIDNPTPTSQVITQPSGIRYWGNTTVLADGTVFLVGGARERQKLNTAVHFGEIWNPELDSWQTVRESIDKKARLYHSVSLLLPDASVLVAGGGPPGPVVNMNADIYYPPYLYSADGSGVKAERPVIQNADPLQHGSTSNVVMSNSEAISRVTLVRSGSVTHAFDSAQRFQDINFTQAGSVLTVTMPRNRNIVPPGLYMVFVFNEEGVPSVAELQVIK